MYRTADLLDCSNHITRKYFIDAALVTENSLPPLKGGDKRQSKNGPEEKHALTQQTTLFWRWLSKIRQARIIRGLLTECWLNAARLCSRRKTAAQKATFIVFRDIRDKWFQWLVLGSTGGSEIFDLVPGSTCRSETIALACPWFYGLFRNN